MPRMEAISSQVRFLRSRFPGSVAWGLHPACTIQLSWSDGLVVHPRFWLPFRGATAVLQRAFSLNHIFGSLGDWFYLRACVRRPIVMTVAVKRPPSDKKLLANVGMFVVEWKSDIEYLQDHGVESDRICVIPPPVDITKFREVMPPPDRFTVMFASSPEKSTELADRGVDIILDVAERRPEYEFVLVWRPWGDSEEVLRGWIARRRLKNITIMRGVQNEMHQLYNRSHVAVALFRNQLNTKSVPNSLIESLACGRPIVTTTCVGMGRDLALSSAGYAVAPERDEVIDALDKLCAEWSVASTMARQFAEEYFSVEKYIAKHRCLYDRALAERS